MVHGAALHIANIAKIANIANVKPGIGNLGNFQPSPHCKYCSHQPDPANLRYSSARSAVFSMLAMLAMGGATQQPSPFRSGTNVIRVDATVIDRTGRAVTSLTADDFEVREDGVLRQAPVRD